MTSDFAAISQAVVFSAVVGWLCLAAVRVCRLGGPHFLSSFSTPVPRKKRKRRKMTTKPDPEDDTDGPLVTRRERRKWLTDVCDKLDEGHSVAQKTIDRARGIAKLERMEQLLAESLGRSAKK